MVILGNQLCECGHEVFVITYHPLDFYRSSLCDKINYLYVTEASNTLFRIDETTEYAVIEMGMQGLGEIHKLTMAAQPQGAIITMIGQSHLEQLGTRENILRAKMEICDGLCEGAPLVINADNDLLVNAQVPPHVRRVTFAIENQNADVRAEAMLDLDAERIKVG